MLPWHIHAPNPKILSYHKHRHGEGIWRENQVKKRLMSLPCKWQLTADLISAKPMGKKRFKLPRDFCKEPIGRGKIIPFSTWFPLKVPSTTYTCSKPQDVEGLGIFPPYKIWKKKYMETFSHPIARTPEAPTIIVLCCIFSTQERRKECCSCSTCLFTRPIWQRWRDGV